MIPSRILTFYTVLISIIFGMSLSSVAGDVFDTIQQFGIAGNWKPDCSQPASRQNLLEVFRKSSDGNPYMIMSNSDNLSDITARAGGGRILDATALDSANIQIKVDQLPTQVAIFTLRKIGGTLRWWELTLTQMPHQADTQTIKDGVAITTQQPTLSYNECS